MTFIFVIWCHKFDESQDFERGKHTHLVSEKIKVNFFFFEFEFIYKDIYLNDHFLQQRKAMKPFILSFEALWLTKK